MNAKVRYYSIMLPRLFMASLYLCVGSGMLLACRYYPFGDVYRQVEELSSLIPFGAFFRGLHLYSGQVCGIMAVLHLLDHLVRGADRSCAPRQWCRLVLAALCCVAMLFTGYILVGDAQGVLAGEVLRGLVISIPVFGGYVASLVIGSGEQFFFIPYFHHCFLLPLTMAVLMHKHIREWAPSRYPLLLSYVLFGSAAFLLPLPATQPPGVQLLSVQGPWFVVGLQELLRYTHPFWGVIIIIGMFVGLLLALPLLHGWKSKMARGALFCGGGMYGVLTIKVFIG